jgi:hypothetical protein
MFVAVAALQEQVVVSPLGCDLEGNRNLDVLILPIEGTKPPAKRVAPRTRVPSPAKQVLNIESEGKSPSPAAGSSAAAGGGECAD